MSAPDLNAMSDRLTENIQTLARVEGELAESQRLLHLSAVLLEHSMLGITRREETIAAQQATIDQLTARLARSESAYWAADFAEQQIATERYYADKRGGAL